MAGTVLNNQAIRRSLYKVNTASATPVAVLIWRRYEETIYQGVLVYTVRVICWLTTPTPSIRICPTLNKASQKTSSPTVTTMIWYVLRLLLLKLLALLLLEMMASSIRDTLVSSPSSLIYVFFCSLSANNNLGGLQWSWMLVAIY